MPIVMQLLMDPQIRATSNNGPHRVGQIRTLLGIPPSISKMRLHKYMAFKSRVNSSADPPSANRPTRSRPRVETSASRPALHLPIAMRPCIPDREWSTLPNTFHYCGPKEKLMNFPRKVRWRTGLEVLLVSACVAASLSLAHDANASSLALPTSADSYVLSSSARANFGSDTSVKESAASSRKQVAGYRGLLRFNTGMIPAGSTINSVTLKVYSKVAAASGGIQVHVERDSWTESAVTWANQPAWNSTVIATTATPAANTWVSVNLPTTAV